MPTAARGGPEAGSNYLPTLSLTGSLLILTDSVYHRETSSLGEEAMSWKLRYAGQNRRVSEKKIQLSVSPASVLVLLGCHWNVKEWVYLMVQILPSSHVCSVPFPCFPNSEPSRWPLCLPKIVPMTRNVKMGSSEFTTILTRQMCCWFKNKTKQNKNMNLDLQRDCSASALPTCKVLTSKWSISLKAHVLKGLASCLLH
jgi:hypothetical protein